MRSCAAAETQVGSLQEHFVVDVGLANQCESFYRDLGG